MPEREFRALLWNLWKAPPGAMKKNLPALTLTGIALLMTLVIAFSGRSATRSSPVLEADKPEPQVVDPSPERIKDYQLRIREATKRLELEQAQLAQLKVQQGVPAPTPETAVGYGTTSGIREVSAVGQNRSLNARISSKRREEESLFASNVALTLRPEKEVGNESVQSNVQTARSFDAERFLRDSQSQPNRADTRTVASPGMPGTESGMGELPVTPTELTYASGKLYRLFEGTFLETVLTNRLDGTYSGPVKCMVANDVYSLNGQRLLIPRGSHVLGRVERVENIGQNRLAVYFSRLIMPDGYSVNLNQFQGLNQVGETGLADQVNNHYVKVFGASLAIGVIGGLAQSNTRYGQDASAWDVYRQGVSASIAQSSLRILDRFLNILPTITIREGHRMKVFLTGDLLLPAYEHHQLASDL